MRTSKLAGKYIVKRNKIRNQCTLLRNQGEEGVLFYLDKLEEIMRACDKLLLTWRTHGSPLGDHKVKETMYRTISKTEDKLEQWRYNSSTGDTLTSLTLIETSLEGIRKIDSAILREEGEAATEFSSILKLLIKKTKNSETTLRSGSGGLKRCRYETPPYQKTRGNIERKYSTA